MPPRQDFVEGDRFARSVVALSHRLDRGAAAGRTIERRQPGYRIIAADNHDFLAGFDPGEKFESRVLASATLTVRGLELSPKCFFAVFGHFRRPSSLQVASPTGVAPIPIMGMASALPSQENSVVCGRAKAVAAFPLYISLLICFINRNR